MVYTLDFNKAILKKKIQIQGLEDVIQLAHADQACTKPWAHLVLHKQGMVVHTCNSCTQGLEAEGQSLATRNFKGSLDLMAACLQTNKQKHKSG